MDKIQFFAKLVKSEFYTKVLNIFFAIKPLQLNKINWLTSNKQHW
jgi:hypothetical protein